VQDPVKRNIYIGDTNKIRYNEKPRNLLSFFFRLRNRRDYSRPDKGNVESFIPGIRETYLKLGEALTVKFLCSIAVLVIKEFHCTCTCIFGILNEFLV